MTYFKVGDIVRAIYTYGSTDQVNIGDLRTVESLDSWGSPIMVEDNDKHIGWDPDMWELVERAPAQSPDVAELQEELNRAVFQWLKKQDERQHDMQAALRYFYEDGDGPVLDAARALQAALQPPEPAVLYGALLDGETAPEKPMTLRDVIEVHLRCDEVLALYPWDGTRFSEPVRGEALAELLEGK